MHLYLDFIFGKTNFCFLFPKIRTALSFSNLQKKERLERLLINPVSGLIEGGAEELLDLGVVSAFAGGIFEDTKFETGAFDYFQRKQRKH